MKSTYFVVIIIIVVIIINKVIESAIITGYYCHLNFLIIITTLHINFIIIVDWKAIMVKIRYVISFKNSL